MTEQNDAILVEEIEMDLLLEGLSRRYGVELRNYARAPLWQHLRRCMQREQVPTISGFLHRVLRDPESLQTFLLELSTSRIQLFCDPDFYRAFRAKVVPLLRTHPVIRLWIAGCVSGEEIYSTAILLEEEGIYERSRIYATDHSQEALGLARAGAFPLSSESEYTTNYLRAGGKKALSDYYSVAADRMMFNPELRRNVTFAEHNLVTDGSFNEFQVVLYRYVMRYFDQSLQERVHELIYQSLSLFGVIGLGPRESLGSSLREACYEPLDEESRLYRKVL
ncbi:MAG TPA: CheR family methyltransferase [Blastocatellia bacterium]|nr:CheR family methyltransferase [Blastocatellia bacterium]